jgi:hypothetical protein
MIQKIMTSDEEVTGSKTFSFAVFSTFERHVTYFMGDFGENVKTVKTTLYSTVKTILV